MPTYLYEVILPDGTPGERFEAVQAMSDPPLKTHPETGQKVRRILTPPNIAGRHTEAAAGKRLEDKNLERLGFTKYVKSGDGQYQKTVGQGPDQIQRG
jgi:hypothetical protein